MKGMIRLVHFTFAMILGVTWAGIGLAEEKGPELKSVSFFGGAGDQGAAQDGMGIGVSGTHLYLSGADLSLYGGQALVASYTIPPGASPTWSFRWPNRKGNGWWNDETFPGLAVTQEGLYCAGRGWALVSDGVGDKETKAILVKFPLNGATGPGAGGALWVAEPHFFPYTGIETFIDVMAVQEGASTFLYATGRGQPDGSSNTAVLAKFDTAGKILWTKVLGKAESFVWSQGTSLATLNGHLYVAGYTHWHKGSNTIRPHAGLWRVDPSGNMVWARESVEPITQNSLNPVCVVPAGDSLYVSAAQENAPNGGADVLLLRYSQAGDVVWSRNWGSSRDDVPMAMVAEGNRLFLAGFTTGWVGGAKDAFLLEMNAENGEVLSVNYHGGANDDVAYGVSVVGKDLFVIGDSKSSPENLGQSEAMLLRYALSREPPVLTVPIDVKPGSFPNPINLKATGNIPVAILSRPDFLAAEVVDRASLTFGRTGDEKSLLPGKVQPEDVNGDGLLDLVCHFGNQTAGFQVGDTRGVLKGKTLEGRPFLGMDSVVIVGQEKELRETPAPIKPPTQEETWRGTKPVPPAPKGESPKGFNPPAGELKKMEKEGSVVY